MVATLVRLRLLVLRNSLSRHPAQLVAVAIGGIYGLGVLVGVVVGLFLLAGEPVPTIRTVVVLAGSAAVLGWALLPVLLTGIDETLEPARLAAYPIPLGRLMAGLGVSAVVGVPGAVTTIAALATAGSWIHQPGIAVLAVVCGALAAATCVVGSRAVAAAASGLSSGRRFREARGTLVIIPLLLLGPVVVALSNGLSHTSADFGAIADGLAWTPLGAAWAIPSSVAAGHPLVAVAEAVIALVTCGVLLLLWRWGLAHAIVAPTSTASRARTPGRLGLFGRLGRGPAGAVAARSLTYWFRDPRYLRQLVVVPLLPVLLWFYGSLQDTDGFLLALGPATAFVLALSIVADVSYDSTAFGLHVAKGVRGVHDRAGRVLAVSVFVLPVVVLFTIASGALTGRWDLVPALLGLSFGVLGAGLGASSVSSALIVMPVPAPGDNPFRARPGANFARSLQVLAIWGVVAVLCLPEIVLFVVTALTGAAVVGWVTLVVGAALGPVLLTVGVRQGGRVLDRRGPELLAQLVRAR